MNNSYSRTASFDYLKVNIHSGRREQNRKTVSLAGKIALKMLLLAKKPVLGT